MHPEEAARAVAAATATASQLGLPVTDTVVLNDSDKLTVRLLPCDVVARIAPERRQAAALEVQVARGLALAGAPVVALDPRVAPGVRLRNGFVITLWTSYDAATGKALPPGDYADALARLHAGFRRLDVDAPHAVHRVEDALRVLQAPDRTREVPAGDRALLTEVLGRGRRVLDEHSGRQQLLHGEPHPGNVLDTSDGPLFIDFETCCRGPVELDLAHAPEAVADHYPGVDETLLHECRLLVLAMITAWRLDPADQLPDGQRLAAQWLGQLRALL
ncbi:phosphotransferase family enzyme [Motilibacter peucedani]|uniref:Phosphotransferase family enzyme n=1 Tax=Motilibacter peucedani TaxID=598650 RepID=A0A420XJR5_9ACTN|nr:phosphotransferase [Motilibacter peucedani]RKS67974.1 phosphotransferase family enzyme [Motilibacter peucedani]